MRPAPEEVPEPLRGYVALVPEEDVLPVLAEGAAVLAAVAGAVPADRETWSYAPGKWSVRQVFGHLADAERVLGFRAFWFARGEAAPLPSFDEDACVARSGADAVPLADHLADFRLLRETNLRTLRRLPDAAWSRRGIASGAEVSVRALAFALAGHLRHHLSVLASRYGVSAAGSSTRTMTPSGPPSTDR